MRAQEPKAAVRVGGRPMAARVADAMRGAGISRIVAVVGHRGTDVRAAIGAGIEYVVQDQQLGTGHAAKCARIALADYEGPVIVAYADIPLLTEEDIARLIERHLLADADATMLTAVLAEPGTLGRIMRGADGSVQGIVEARDATEEQLKVREINVGVYCFEAPLLFELLGELKNDNAQSQYYLTDVIGLLVGRGRRVEAISLETAHNGMGVDTAEDLARAQQLSTSGEPV
jgi:bifunctional UDP-N-acetylglucosamine pyrophosphorylase/glucosamine-1-phosphate N-acetyltransferase